MNKKQIMLTSVFGLSALFPVMSLAASLDISSFENGSQNQSIPSIQLKNNGERIDGFKVYYYFSAADTKNIISLPYYVEGASVNIEKVSANQYRAALDFSEISIPTGYTFPSSGNLQFGLHYGDWSVWQSENVSNAEQSLNNRIVVESVDGKILAGAIPSENNFVQQQKSVQIFSKAVSDGSYGRFFVYAKNDGNVALDHFDFDVEFSADNDAVPEIEKWFTPNTTVTLNKKNDSEWIAHFSVSNVNLNPGAIFPNESGLNFGIHYTNWSNFDASNDYSLANVNNGYAANDKIAAYVDGNLVSGNPKIHDIEDLKKLLSAESGYAMEKLNASLEQTFENVSASKTNWEELESIESIIVGNMPNFDNVDEAFEQILTQYPGMDEEFLTKNYKDVREAYSQLSRIRMAEYFKFKQSNALPKAKMRTALAKDNTYDFGDISLTEKEFYLLAESPMRYPGTRRAYEFSKDWAKEYASSRNLKGSNPNNATDNRADAVRHAIYNALLCRETGTQFDKVSDCIKWAKDFATAHEQNNDKNAYDTKMDFHNNEFAREYYRPKLKVGCEWKIGVCINEEVVGPSREETKAMFFALADKAYPFNSVDQLSNLPWHSSLVYFRNDAGKYFCPTKSSCVTYNAPEVGAVKVGVLKKDSKASCPNEVTIRLDGEDDKSDTRIVSGSSPAGIKLESNGNITFTYCTFEYDGANGKIPRVPYDYIVLRLDVACPVGTYPFRRHHDNEDNNNNNKTTGDIGFNIVGSNADLEYCFVPADSKSSRTYPVSKQYGVFSSKSSSNINMTKVKVDDEDNNNKNGWEWYDTPSDIQTRIQKIIEGGSNTFYKVIKWIELSLAKVLNWENA